MLNKGVCKNNTSMQDNQKKQDGTANRTVLFSYNKFFVSENHLLNRYHQNTLCSFGL